MIGSIHSSAFTDSGWPKTWPPFKFPPPSPLQAASDSLWTPAQLKSTPSNSTTSTAIQQPTLSLSGTGTAQQSSLAVVNSGRGLRSMNAASTTTGTDTATGSTSQAPLYSAQLSLEGKTSTNDTQANFEMALLDKRIALVRYDTGHTSVAA